MSTPNFTGIESSLSPYAGPYVSEMLGKGAALASLPYQEYGGPLTAGASDLQTTAFQGLGNLAMPQASTAGSFTGAAYTPPTAAQAAAGETGAYTPATDNVLQQMQEMQAAQQSGQVPPDQLQQQQSQIQMQIEQLSSPILAQLTQELLESIGQGDETDPLVQIRQQELMLKEKAIDSENEQFEAKQQQRAEEKLLENEIAKQRMNIQREVADDKLDVAIRRLDQQADLKLLDMQNKNMGGR